MSVFRFDHKYFHLHTERTNIVCGNEHATRKRFTEMTKIEMREHYALTKNYVESAKENIHDHWSEIWMKLQLFSIWFQKKASVKLVAENVLYGHLGVRRNT